MNSNILFIKSLPGILLVITLLYGCTDVVEESFCPDTYPDTGSVEIRVRNISSYDFNEVFVDTNGGQHDYCTVKSGATSGYKRFESAYRYAFIELKIDGAVFTIQPIDYVGESLLDKGKYTYVLDATDDTQRYGRLSIELKSD